MKPFDLVLFDLGGVIADMDRELIFSLVSQTGEDPMPAFLFYRGAYENGGDDDHPLHRAERGEIDNATLVELVSVIAPIANLVIQSGGILSRVLRPNLGWGSLVEELAVSGFESAALTNTFDGVSFADFEITAPELHRHLGALFGDRIIQSHLVGMRKPNPKIFAYAASYFSVDPKRVLFIDDEATNCEAARSVGMTAMQNLDGEATRVAVRNLLGL